MPSPTLKNSSSYSPMALMRLRGLALSIAISAATSSWCKAATCAPLNPRALRRLASCNDYASKIAALNKLLTETIPVFNKLLGAQNLAPLASRRFLLPSLPAPNKKRKAPRLSSRRPWQSISPFSLVFHFVPGAIGVVFRHRRGYLLSFFT